MRLIVHCAQNIGDDCDHGLSYVSKVALNGKPLTGGVIIAF